MGTDRYITWGETPEWGPPTPEKLAAVARDFLGEGWTTTIRDYGGLPQIVVDSKFKSTFHLASERPEMGNPYAAAHKDDEHATRGFEIYFESDGKVNVVTRVHYCDSFTSALVERYVKIIARWWGGEVEWPG
jgi:hypothetical protein